MEMDEQQGGTVAKRSVHLEVLRPSVSNRGGNDQVTSDDEVKELVLDSLNRVQLLIPGVLTLDALDGGKAGSALRRNVSRVLIDIDDDFEGKGGCPPWQAELSIHVYRLNEEGSYDETTEEDPTATVFTHWELPAAQFDGLWESLLFESQVKALLLDFASASLYFSKKDVDPTLISWNHVVLLHGPPGTGKTSLCCALAHKLSIRLMGTFKQTQLLEINSHSLFSKWFSESGKLVSKLFAYINELAEDEDTLVCILIDEVESLAAARSAALSGSEPSDSIRVVNALLTQIDRLKSKKNVLILTTSNITEAIDLAFVDRADIRQYIGLPTQHVRKMIIEGCVQELVRSGVVSLPQNSSEDEKMVALLDSCATATQGLSGRALRKLPFQTHARSMRQPGWSLGSMPSVTAFLTNMVSTATKEKGTISSAENK